MQLHFKNKSIRTFVISPRTQNKALYWSNIKNVARWAEHYEYSGILIFTGNDTYIEPWVVAQDIILSTSRISPLVAVNPVYMHPFTAAKFNASLSNLYSRKIYLNMTTGTALNYLVSLNDHLDYDQRYERLAEYAELLMKLLSSSTPISFSGQYCTVSNLQLLSEVPRSLWPELLFAGQSEAARNVCNRFNGISMAMLQPSSLLDTAMARGVVAWRTEKEAWHAARSLFSKTEQYPELLDLIMKNTDSIWKRKLHTIVADADSNEQGFWITPFKNLEADCLYFVGDYAMVADLIDQVG